MNEWELTMQEIMDAINSSREHSTLVAMELHYIKENKAIANEAQKKLMKYIFDNMRMNELNGEAWKKLCYAFLVEE